MKISFGLLNFEQVKDVGKGLYFVGQATIKCLSTTAVQPMNSTGTFYQQKGFSSLCLVMIPISPRLFEGFLLIMTLARKNWLLFANFLPFKNSWNLPINSPGIL